MLLQIKLRNQWPNTLADNSKIITIGLIFAVFLGALLGEVTASLTNIGLG